MLVYYGIHSPYLEAARRKTRFKKLVWRVKTYLIDKFNPMWRDLYEIGS